jgi:hypothetical protein
MNKENAYQFGIRNGVFQYALTNSGGSWDWYATDSVVRQGWQHIAFVVSRTTNTIRFYYNGELAGDTTNSTAIPGTGANSSGAFTIGNRSAFNEYYTGDIDEVRLYSSARSAADIKTDMYTYGTTNATNLVAYYDFNEASNTLITTISVRMNNAGITTSNWVFHAARKPVATARSGIRPQNAPSNDRR